MSNRMMFAALLLWHPDSVGFTPQGHRVPEGIFSQETIDRFLKKGYITELPTEAAPAVASIETVHPDYSDWAFDPLDLIDKDLETLNILARDHALRRSIEVPEPFESEADAVEFMTKQFKGS